MKTIINRILLLVMVCALFTNYSLALTVGDCCFLEDFSGYNSSDGALPIGWSASGSGKTAVDSYAGSVPVTSENRLMRISELFPDNSHPYVMLDLENNGEYIPYCNTSTKEGGNVDEWLITPVIDLGNVGKSMLLSFDVVLYGSNKPAPVSVYMSSSDASQPSDFGSGLLYTGSFKGSAKQVVRERVYVSLPIEAISDMDAIRLAFVCTGVGSQLVGFTNFCISEYEVALVNHTPSFTMTTGAHSADLSINLHYPEKCESLTCTLRTDEGEQSLNRIIPEGDALDYSVDISFSDAFQLDYRSDIHYDIELTLGDEQAQSYTQRFQIICREGYPSVCVMEEATGAWCPSCVRGIAAFEKYDDQWGKRFIGIAIHNNDEMTVDDFDLSFRKASGISSFPNAWFNRTKVDNPINEKILQSIMTNNITHKVEINRVEYDSETSEVTVDFATECCYTDSETNLSIAFVVLQDDFEGLYQQNGYSGCTKQDVGVDWWPYFMRFSSEASTITPFVFDHVARGIFPDMQGDSQILPTAYVEAVAAHSTYKFRMPELLGDGDYLWRKSAVVALLIDVDSGVILSADKFDGSDYIVDGAGLETTISLPVSVYYTDLMGRRIISPCPNRYYIKTVVYNDGSRRTSKQLFR